MNLANPFKRKTGKGKADAAPVDEIVAAAPAKAGFSFQNIIDDFRTMDPKDPGLWPTAPRALILMGLFLALMAASWGFGAGFGWSAQVEELAGKRADEDKLRTEWLDKKRQAVNLDAYRAQLAEIDASFGVLLEQLPNQSEIGALLVDVNKTAQANGLSIELFKPGGEGRKEFYAEIPIDLQLMGTYHDMGAFTGELAQLPRIVTLNNLDISVGKNESLLVKARAKTFRYLDEAELATIRSNAKKAKGKKK